MDLSYLMCIFSNLHVIYHCSVHTLVKDNKGSSDTKYVAIVLALGTECDIGEDV